MSEDHFGRLFDNVVAARIHYGIWYVFKNEVDRPKYVDVMNKYPWFFPPSLSAHFVAMLMALSTIYDDGPNNVSLYRVLRELESADKVDGQQRQEIEQRVKDSESIVKKILMIRNNVFAHLSAKVDPFEAFKKANITMNNFRGLIYETAAILNQMGLASGYGTRNLVESSEHDTRDMLGDIEKVRVEAMSGGERK
ncbi:MAG: hypothetical protein HY211_02815 [Candidatus Omnitrophica bacterium]|nr:hypothetical protein [Candidatus Omnitrophota bacterium]